ncbi:MAG: response regulator [Magnetococcus sp. THC-1_WYH]
MTQRKSRIMIVDDERLNINVLNDILKEDYQIKVAMTGEQALKRAVSDPKPDLILLDIQMPGMGGYEVCSQLKSDPVTHDIPVIFITNLTDEEDEKKGLAMGAVDYLIKPLRPSIIQARVRTHLGLKQARESLAERNKELERLLILRETVEQISRHDLKGPLSGILGYTQLLLEADYFIPDHRQLLAMQERAGYKMLEMINRSLDMLKMEQGNYVLDPEPVDLLLVVHRIFGEVRYLPPRLFLNGEPVRPGDTFIIRGEELLCYSMLSNIIKNAAEASANKEPVTIWLDTGNMAQVRVQNSGVVPEVIRGRFFEKYITTGKSGGTGLGTYSAWLIAQTLGGTIHMDSSPQQGTIITLFLPHWGLEHGVAGGDSWGGEPTFHLDHGTGGLSRDDNAGDDNAGDENSGDDNSGLSILLADDTEESRMVIHYFLQHTAHRLTMVADGTQALDCFKSGGFNLVLMDIHMPGMDGYQAVGEMRAWELAQHLPPTPILALTGSNTRDEIERTRQAGFNLHLSKPIGRQKLLDTVEFFAEV